MLNTDLPSPSRFTLVWEWNVDTDTEISAEIIQKFLLLTLWRLGVRVTKNLILVAEDIIVDIKFVCNRTLEVNQREEPIQLHQL